MAQQLTASFVKIDDSSSQQPRPTEVYQYIDILKSDISDALNRKNYEVFITGGTNQSNVRSTLYQTIFDQDFTLSTANPLFDMTLGLSKEDITGDDGTIIPRINGVDYSYDARGKVVGFDSELMIREKVNIYRQFAQNLLGDPDYKFVAPHGESIETAGASEIKSAIFITFRRLFTRDNIYKGTFTMNISRQIPFLQNDARSDDDASVKGSQITNLEDIYTLDNQLDTILEVSDASYSERTTVSPVAGEVTTLTSVINGVETNVGLIYYDKGIVILDTEVLFDNTQTLRGIIDSTSTSGISDAAGPWYVFDEDNSIGYKDLYTTPEAANAKDILLGGEGTYSELENPDLSIDNTLGEAINFWQPRQLQSGDPLAITSANEEPSDQPKYDFSVNATNNDFYSSVADPAEGYALFEGTLKSYISEASIEDLLTHFCATRFGNENESAITFQNQTIINSKIYYCRAAPSQLNYSTNPTYVNSDGEIIAKVGSSPFAYVTSVGLFDSTGELVAVAKTSRPIEKNSETDLTINVRLDY